MHGILIIALVLGVLLLILMATYNGLMHQRQEVREAWGKIDQQLKLRYDLVPELTSIVQDIGGEPAGKIPAITAAKNQAAVAFNPQQLASAENALSDGIADLLSSIERDPAMNADPRVIGIRQKLLACEKKIDAARAQYNDRVSHLNESTHSFPIVLTARLIGLKQLPKFDLPA